VTDVTALAQSVRIGQTTYAAGTDHTAMPAAVVDQIRNPNAWVGGVAPALSGLPVPGKAQIRPGDLSTPAKAHTALGLGTAALIDAVHGNAKDHGAKADGTTDDRAAVAEADAVPGDLLLPPGIYRIASNLTISSPVTFAQGALLRPASGVRVTLSGRLTAPAAKIFDLSLGGTVTVREGNGGTASPTWWGALPDTGTDQSVALAAALTSMVGQNRPLTLNFGAGVWRCDSGLTIDPTFVNLRGAGTYQTTLEFANMTSGTAITVAKLNGDNRRHMVMEGFEISGPLATDTTVDGMQLGSASTYANQCGFVRLRFNGFRNSTIFGSNSWAVSFRECSWRNAVSRSLYCATGGVNYGENYSLHDCSIFGGTGTGLAAETGGWSFYSTSFDYLPRAMAISGDARVEAHGCWFETGDPQANGATEFISVSTANAYSGSLVIKGGTLHPAYTASGTYTAFVRISGITVGGNHSAVDIDGLYIDSASTANANVLVYDAATVGTESGNHNVGDVTIRALRYRDSSSGANFPWRYRDRSARMHNLVAGIDLGNPTLEHWRANSGWTQPTIHLAESMPRLLAKDKATPATGDFYLIALPPLSGGVPFSQFEVMCATAAQGSGVTITLGLWTSSGGTVSRFNSNTVSPTGANQFRSVTIAQSGGLRTLGVAVPMYVGIWLTTTTTMCELRGLALSDALNPLLGQAGSASSMPLVAGKLTGQATRPDSFAQSALAVPDFVPWAAVRVAAY
jgi:hypothetical protein